MSTARLTKLPTIVLLVAGCLVLAAGPLFPQAGIPRDEVTRESLKFTRVVQLVRQNYMAKINPDQVILEGAVRGMLASLDPFSSFFDRNQFEALKEETGGEAIGFGSILYVQPGKVTVIQTQQGSPSWRAGLGPGDEITAVNGIWLEGLSFRHLIQVLEQAKSHPVHLRVFRPGETIPHDISMRPAEVNLPTVDTVFVNSHDVGFIHVASFESQTPRELIAALQKLDFTRLKGLILDLRNNPGGLLASAVNVCSLFLKPGTKVLTVEGRAVPRKTYRTVPVPLHVSLPLIVLVNGSTASAAEVVTGALQDHDRALIVGEPTFGKGVIETVMPLDDQMGLALLTAEYFTPSGRCLQKPLPGTALQNPVLGIRPASLDPHSRRRLLFRTDHGRPVRADGGISPDVRAADWHLDPWLVFLNQSGMFASFASQYVNLATGITRSFEPDSQTLSAFRAFLTSQRIRSPESDWSRDQPYLKTRIRTEIFNLVFGLDYGNQVAAESDPQVQKAASLFPLIPSLLSGPARHSYAGSRTGRKAAKTTQSQFGLENKARLGIKKVMGSQVAGFSVGGRSEWVGAKKVSHPELTQRGHRTALTRLYLQ